MPFPPDWLAGEPGVPASDLELVVLLVNSYDGLEDPPDRLHDLTWLRSALHAAHHDRLADDLRDRDVPALRALRDRLRSVFQAADPATAVEVLNPLLIEAAAVPELV